MTPTFDFGPTDSRLDQLFAFIDHWIGSREPGSELSEADDSHLSNLAVPEPLLRFHRHTGNRQDRNGDWLWDNAVPGLFRPTQIQTAGFNEGPITEDWLLVGEYLGQCQVFVAPTSDDSLVVELDGEEIIEHSSLRDFLVRFALRHLATSQMRWAPIANYESHVLDMIDTNPPLFDASWRPETPEIVWLIEDGDVLVYQHPHHNGERVSLNARNDEVLTRLLDERSTA